MDNRGEGESGVKVSGSGGEVECGVRVRVG